MKKKGLIVVDLDSTLIDFDSFRYLVIKNIWDYHIIYFLLLRTSKLISRYELKEKTMMFLIKKKGEVYFDELVTNIVKNINKEVFNEISNYKVADDLILLLSASPKYYVTKIAKRLGWKAYGSTFKTIDYDSDFESLHLYGEEKINYLLKYYPRDIYSYKYAVSDSISDINLLTLFENYKLIDKK